MNTKVSPQELQSQIATGNPPTLIDVRLADDFAAEHVPGAINHAVFEVVFLGAVEAALSDKSTPIVLCGAAADSHEAPMAAEKLERAGYSDVAQLDGGLEAWLAAGLVTDRGEPLPDPPAIADGAHSIDLAESKVEWLGRNLLNKHWGTIGLKSGQLEFVGGQLSGGEFTIDMGSIQCTDLAGDKMHDVLIDHLKSDDFFDVALHPEARFELSRVAEKEAASPGSPNLQIEGSLTLRGNTRPVKFAASSGTTPKARRQPRPTSRSTAPSGA